MANNVAVKTNIGFAGATGATGVTGITGPTGSGSSGTNGTATLDFGTGTTDTTVVVTGQTGILTGSQLKVRIKVIATTNHVIDEIWIENVEVYAGNIVAGTGFTIYGKSLLGLVLGQFTIEWSWS
jgi:hypothetical protein